MVDVMIGVVLLIGQALGDSAARRFPRLFEPGSDMSAAFGWLMIVILLMAGWCVVQAFG